MIPSAALTVNNGGLGLCVCFWMPEMNDFCGAELLSLLVVVMAMPSVWILYAFFFLSVDNLGFLVFVIATKDKLCSPPPLLRLWVRMMVVVMKGLVFRVLASMGRRYSDGWPGLDGVSSGMTESSAGGCCCGGICSGRAFGISQRRWLQS